jgi:hypothetical protein
MSSSAVFQSSAGILPSASTQPLSISLNVDPLATKKALEHILGRMALRRNGHKKALDPAPSLHLSPTQERRLIEVCHGFLHRTLEQTCVVAKLRQQSHAARDMPETLTFEDLAFVLDMEFGISLPPPLVLESGASSGSNSKSTLASAVTTSATLSTPMRDASPSTRLPRRRPMPLLPTVRLSGVKKTTVSAQKRKASAPM